MKPALIAFIIAFCACIASAQDPGLPEGKVTIGLKSGQEIKNVRLWSVTASTIEYETEGNLHDIPVPDVARIGSDTIRYAAGDHTVHPIPDDFIIHAKGDTIRCIMKQVNDNLRKLVYLDRRLNVTCSIDYALVSGYGLQEGDRLIYSRLSSPDDAGPASGDQTTDYFTLGKADGKEYYNGTGTFIGSMLAGPFVAPIMAVIPPAGVNGSNPNGSLYYSNEQYRAGYKKGAHGKKVANALSGMLTGLFLWIALAGIP